jgi:hypothetical protein
MGKRRAGVAKVPSVTSITPLLRQDDRFQGVNVILDEGFVPVGRAQRASN